MKTTSWCAPTYPLQNGDYAVLGDLGALLVVADGMGGANAGEVASAIAVHTIQQMFAPENIRGVVNDDSAIQSFMKDVVKSADLNIFRRSQQDESARGMGTTIVMAWILGTRAYVCWCGDSRCYAFNYNRGLLQISKDHSYVQELVDHGELEPEYMHDHPLSNVITRCLGDMEKRANPDTKVYELADGDTVMLCSDGLCGYCTDDDIRRVFASEYVETDECCQKMLDCALDAGGADNIAIVMASLIDDGQEKPDVVKPSWLGALLQKLFGSRGN